MSWEVKFGFYIRSSQLTIPYRCPDFFASSSKCRSDSYSTRFACFLNLIPRQCVNSGMVLAWTCKFKRTYLLSALADSTEAPGGSCQVAFGLSGSLSLPFLTKMWKTDLRRFSYYFLHFFSLCFSQVCSLEKWCIPYFFFNRSCRNHQIWSLIHCQLKSLEK